MGGEGEGLTCLLGLCVVSQRGFVLPVLPPEALLASDLLPLEDFFNKALQIDRVRACFDLLLCLEAHSAMEHACFHGVLLLGLLFSIADTASAGILLSPQMQADPALRDLLDIPREIKVGQEADQPRQAATCHRERGGRRGLVSCLT